MLNALRPVFKIQAIQKVIKSMLGKSVVGPDVELRVQLPTYVWGEAKNVHGQTKTARIQTDNAYSLTVNGSITVVRYLLENQVKAGSYTPAKLMGYHLVTQISGSGSLIIS